MTNLGELAYKKLTYENWLIGDLLTLVRWIYSKLLNLENWLIKKLTDKNLLTSNFSAFMKRIT